MLDSNRYKNTRCKHDCTWNQECDVGLESRKVYLVNAQRHTRQPKQATYGRQCDEGQQDRVAETHGRENCWYQIHKLMRSTDRVCNGDRLRIP